MPLGMHTRAHMHIHVQNVLTYTLYLDESLQFKECATMPSVMQAVTLRF